MKVLTIIIATGLLISCGEDNSKNGGDASPDKDWWDVETADEGGGDTDKSAEKKDTGKKDDGKGGGKSPLHRWTGSLNLADKTGSLRYFANGDDPCDITFPVTIGDTSVDLCEDCVTAKEITYGEPEIVQDGNSCVEAIDLKETTNVFGWLKETGEGKDKEGAALRRYVDDAWEIEEHGYVLAYKDDYYLAWGEPIVGDKQK